MRILPADLMDSSRLEELCAEPALELLPPEQAASRPVVPARAALAKQERRFSTAEVLRTVILGSLIYVDVWCES